MPAPVQDGIRLDVAKLKAALPAAILKVKEERGETFVCVKRDEVLDVLSFLKNDPELDYGYFVECVGVDYSAWTGERDLPESRFEVIYNIFSLKHDSRLFIKVGANDGETVPSAKNLFIGADYPEREIWDLLGVVFAGNEQSERFLLPDDWIGFPLRKDVPLGGEDVVFHAGTEGPAVEDISMPHAGSSFEGKTGSQDVSGR